MRDKYGLTMLVVYAAVLAALIYMALLLEGCGLFSSGVPAAVETMVGKAADRVAKMIGKELGDVPMECEFEIDQKGDQLLMLCTADLKDMR